MQKEVLRAQQASLDSIFEHEKLHKKWKQFEFLINCGNVQNARSSEMYLLVFIADCCGVNKLAPGNAPKQHAHTQMKTQIALHLEEKVSTLFIRPDQTFADYNHLRRSEIRNRGKNVNNLTLCLLSFATCHFAFVECKTMQMKFLSIHTYGQVRCVHYWS